jgi:hypothetical protein
VSAWVVVCVSSLVKACGACVCSLEMSTVIILLFGVGGGVGVLAGGAAGQLLYSW